MRIWSFHPKYLDTKGLVALWREALLAKKVLENKTKGYKNHPQLDRFKNSIHPLDSINYYLSIIFVEASARNFNFDKEKFKQKNKIIKQKVTEGQLRYEFEHLKQKLLVRDPKKIEEIKVVQLPEPHPLFEMINGNIESWEKVK
jgi:hypothetical protein